MRALLRYAILKTSREQLLPGLILAPGMLFLAPLLGIAIDNGRRGQQVFPMSLDVRLGPRGSVAMMMGVVLLLTAVVSGIAAFRMFRSEVMSKAVGSFYLATPPRTVSIGTTIYGAMVGTAAYLIAIAILSTLSATLPSEFGRNLAIAVITAAFSSALGSLTLAISDDFTMLVPVCAGGLAVSVALTKSGGTIPMAAAVVGIAVMMAVAQIIWRRRCVV